MTAMIKLNRFVVFVCLTFTCLFSAGQDPFEFPEEDAAWVNAFYLTNDEDPNYPFCELIQNINYCVVSGDTTINDVNYIPLYQCDADGSSSYFGAFRNFDKKVFLIPSGDEDELLIYDFDPAEGEEVTIYTYPEPELWYPQTYIANNVTVESINGVDRTTHQAIDSQIISGIGNASGLFSFLDAILNGCNELDCVSQGDDVLWGDNEGSCALDISVPEQHDLEISIWPNPSDSQWNVTFSNVPGEGTCQLISLQGEILFKASFVNGNLIIDGTTISPGIYFLDIFSEGLRTSTKIIKN